MDIVSRSQMRSAIRQMFEARWNAQTHWSPKAKSKIKSAETQCRRAERKLHKALTEANKSCDSELWRNYKEKQDKVNELLSRRYDF